MLHLQIWYGNFDYGFEYPIYRIWSIICSIGWVLEMGYKMRLRLRWGK